jgi:hypothetical protein
MGGCFYRTVTLWLAVGPERQSEEAARLWARRPPGTAPRFGCAPREKAPPRGDDGLEERLEQMKYFRGQVLADHGRNLDEVDRANEQ